MATHISLVEKHPEFYKPDSGVDRRGMKRTVPMEVLNLGMPRTGTASMQVAFQILGIPTFHSLDFMNNIRDCALWDEALDAKFVSSPSQPFSRSQWDSVIGHYGAVCDVPAIAFSEDLIAIYPEAKVVLVERDIESWYKSFNEAVVVHTWSPLLWFCGRVDPFFVRPMEQTHKRWSRGYFHSNSADELRKNARAVFREHYALVKRITPAERLLVFNLSDGWGPLCKFLGKDIPDVPFPRVNDTDAMTEKMKLVAWRGLKNGAWRSARVLGPVAVIAAAWWYL